MNAAVLISYVKENKSWLGSAQKLIEFPPQDRDYYEVVATVDRFYTMINNLKDLKSGKFKDDEVEDRYGKFLAEFSLLDIREKK